MYHLRTPSIRTHPWDAYAYPCASSRLHVLLPSPSLPPTPPVSGAHALLLLCPPVFHLTHSHSIPSTSLSTSHTVILPSSLIFHPNTNTQHTHTQHTLHTYIILNSSPLPSDIILDLSYNFDNFLFFLFSLSTHTHHSLPAYVYMLTHSPLWHCVIHPQKCHNHCQGADGQPSVVPDCSTE